MSPTRTTPTRTGSRPRTTRAGFVLLAALACSASAAGCTSSGSEDGSAPVAPAVPGTPDAGDPRDAAMPVTAPCSEPVDKRPAGSACVKTLSGRVVEDTSNQAVALLTTLCGAGLCLLGQGDANAFTVNVNRFVDLDVFVIHVDGRPTHANTYVRMTRAATEAVVLTNPIRVPRLSNVGPELPAATPPVPLATGMVARAGDVALTLAAGTTIELDFADASLQAEGRKLRSGPVSSELANDPRIVALHALAPFAATVKPAAEVGITLPAAAGIVDGTAVDLVALEDALDSPQTGTLRVVGTAIVNGGVAKSDPGSGLARLTWIGVRKKGN